MSKFTESFHLRHSNENEAKRLLTAIGVQGIIYEETNGWTTVVPLDEHNSQVANISAHFRGTVLHYLYDEDYAWMINLFSHSELISNYVSLWKPEYYIKDDLLNIDAFFKYLVTPDAQSEFKMIFVLDDFEEIFEVNPAYRFAQLLGIKNYRRLNDKDIPLLGAKTIPRHNISAAF